MKRRGSWYKEGRADENLTAAVGTLALSLGLNVTESGISGATYGHPFFPSLASAADALRGWGLDAEAFRIQPDLLSKVPLPCLAYVEDQGGRFVVLTGVEKGKISLVDTARGPMTETLEDFSDRWDGTILAVEMGEGAGEEGYKEKAKAETRVRWRARAAQILVFFGAAGVVVWSALALLPTPLLLRVLAAKLIGILVSGLLVTHYLGQANSALLRFCQPSEKVNCRQVLDSPAAKLFGWIPLADVGLVYFMGGLLALFLAALVGESVDIAGTLGWLSALALPFAAFSVYYQWRVIKQWCWLCLAVQGLFVVEVAATFGAQGGFVAPAVSSVLFVLFSLTVVSGIWMSVRPSLGKAAELEDWRHRYYRLLRHPGVVRHFLEDAAEVPISSIPGELRLGNEDAAHEVMLITHPQCVHCARAHREAVALFDRFDGRVALRVRFFCPEPEGPGKSLAVYCTALQIEGRAEDAVQLLNHWYGGGRDPDGWKASYPLGDAERSMKLAEEAVFGSTLWARSVAVQGTPAFFVNHRQLTPELRLSDLDFFLEDDSGHQVTPPFASA